MHKLFGLFDNSNIIRLLGKNYNFKHKEMITGYTSWEFEPVARSWPFKCCNVHVMDTLFIRIQDWHIFQSISPFGSAQMNHVTKQLHGWWKSPFAFSSLHFHAFKSHFCTANNGPGAEITHVRPTRSSAGSAKCDCVDHARLSQGSHQYSAQVPRNLIPSPRS